MNRLILTLCILAWSLALPLRGQEIAGTITGSVQDPAGAQIPAAAIAARNVDTGIVYRATATEAGIYVLPLLPAGTYQISAEAQGFKRFVRDGLTLTPDQRLRVDIRLEIGALSEQVSVTAESPLVATDQSNTGASFEPSLADSLPVGRGMASLLQFVPGVQQGGNGYWVGNINGSQENTTDFKVDGVPATNNNNGLTNATPMLELVEQVVVLTSDYSAEFGRGATQVQMTTRSGANQFHGALFEYFSNGKLNANAFMSNFYGFPKPATNANVFGGTLSGPVLIPGVYNGRNRTFFTFGYQGDRNREYNQIVSSVPLPAHRAGDFSGGATIYDIDTTRPSGSGYARDAFPGNRIPASRMDPVALKVMEIGFPLPNQPGAANNYVNSGANHGPKNAINTRGDHNISDRSRLTARYLYRQAFNTRLQTFDNPAGAGGGSNFLHKNVFNHVASADHVYTLRPNLVNNARFGYYRMFSPAETLGVNEDWAARIGLKNVGPDKFPQMKINALATLGGGAYSRQVPANTYQFSESLLAIAGRHSVRAGLELRRLQYYTWNSSANSGQFNFNPQPTANVQTLKQGIGLAAFLLGIPNGATVSLQAKDGYSFRWNTYAGYLQDDYRATNRLTLNLGLRWEAESPRREIQNRQSNLNLKTLTLNYAGQNGYPATLHDGNWRNFAPRVGFAYTLTGDARTVVRGAYGIFYLTANTEEGQTNFTTGPWSRTYSYSSLDGGVSFPLRLRTGVPAMSLNEPFALSLLTGTQWMGRDYPTGYMQQWNLNLQREIKGTVFQAGYQGTKGTHLRLTYDLNQVPVNLLGPGDSQSRRPYPGVGGISALKAPVGASTYHAFQTRFERRMSGGFSFQGAYTFSKSIDNVSVANLQNNYDLRSEKSISLFDMTHNLAYSVIYELPFGKGRRALNRGGIADVVLGGWNFGVISSVRSGNPLSMGTTTNLTGSMGGASRPNRLRDGKLPETERNRLRWFDASAFALPEPYTFGNDSATEPSLRAPGQFNWDLLLSKNFNLGEKRRLTFRSEFFNAFNHFNAGAPNTTIGDPGVAVITAGSDPRNIQFSLKLYF